jgi:hypothetical protein
MRVGAGFVESQNSATDCRRPTARFSIAAYETCDGM